jgi:tRNA(Ile)-lysidine synthase TilS/MesJ/uncharacterized protein (DUF924 family)
MDGVGICAGPALFALFLLSPLAARLAVRRGGGGGGGGGYEECADVRAVLAFWFDGDTAENYKTKWFPSSNKDIKENADRQITERFGLLLDQAVSSRLGHWGNSVKAVIAKIIVLDQFSRHIYRHLPPEAAERAAADQQALALTEELLQGRYGRGRGQPAGGWQDALTTPEFVFALMPLRHSSTLGRLAAVLAYIEERTRTGVSGKDQELLSKFYKQTLRRQQALQDRAKLEAAGDIVDHHYFPADDSLILHHPIMRTVLAFLHRQLQGTAPHTDAGSGAARVLLAVSLSGGVDSMALARALAAVRDAGLIGLVDGAVHIAAPPPLVTGAGAGAGRPPKDKNANDSDTPRKQQDRSKHNSGPSGGQGQGQGKVRDAQTPPPPTPVLVTVIAMHIDYGNRPESGEEASFVEQYAREVLRLDWRVRRVTEVTRGVTDRSDYEKISRNIRYGFYKDTLREYTAVHGAGAGAGTGVIFGHHIGDVQENVISNVMRGSSALCLSGMAEVGLTEGVCVWRPLLGRGKEEIYDFAHLYGVPYLQDSTPSWSTRGKLRNALLPLLLEVYGSGCLRNLSSLAADSDAMRGLLQSTVFDPFLAPVRRCRGGVSLTITPRDRDQGAAFWAEALKQIMHSMGMSLVRERAVQNFIGRIHIAAKEEKGKEKGRGGKAGGDRAGRHVSFRGTDGGVCGIMPGWVELRKNFHCYIDASDTLCILRPGLLRATGGGAVSRAAGKASVKPAAAPAPAPAVGCVEVRVSAAGGVSGADVVSAGGGGGAVEVSRGRGSSGGAGEEDGDGDGGQGDYCIKLASPLGGGGGENQSVVPPQTPLLDIRCEGLCLPLSRAACFYVEYGVWSICVRLMPRAGGAAGAARAAAAGPSTPRHVSSPACSDGEMSDQDEDGVWSWSPGVTTAGAGAGAGVTRSMSPADSVGPTAGNGNGNGNGARQDPLPPVLSDIHDLLRGEFCYEFPLYRHNCGSGSGPGAGAVPLRLMAGATAAGARALRLESLRGLDPRIREGLPLLCPVNVAEGADLGAPGDAVCTVAVCYSYIRDERS